MNYLVAMLIFLVLLLSAALIVALSRVRRLRGTQRATLEELPTGLCILEQQRVVQWNDHLVQISGITAERAMGNEVAALPAPWPAAFNDALTAKPGDVIKRSLGEDPNGNPRWLILHSGPVPNPAQRRFVLVEDISDYQRLQDELLHNERLASVGRLAAGVAHEIGNPVTGIACIAQNLVDGADAVEVEQGSAEILKQTERINRTVAALMQLSHPGSSSDNPQCLPCNLADCVDEAIHLLSLKLDGTATRFDNRCDREVLVNADAQLLLQVALNLLDNAHSAASEEGDVLVTSVADDDTVRWLIDNPGPPMDSHQLSQVFEPFYTTKDVGEGTGLGLPLVRSMLEDMDGSIQLLSPIPGGGFGTRAQVTLRRASYATDFTGQT